MQPRLCCHLARQRHLPSIGRIARCLLVTLQRRLMSHLSQPFLYDLRHIASGSCQAQRDITLGSRYHSLDNVKEGFYNVSLTKVRASTDALHGSSPLPAARIWCQRGHSHLRHSSRREIRTHRGWAATWRSRLLYTT